MRRVPSLDEAIRRTNGPEAFVGVQMRIRRFGVFAIYIRHIGNISQRNEKPAGGSGIIL